MPGQRTYIIWQFYNTQIYWAVVHLLLNIGADGLQHSKPQKKKKTIVMGQQSWLNMKMMTLSNQLAAEEKKFLKL